MALTLSAGAGSAMVDALVDRLDGGSAGTIKIYSGVRPSTPDDAVSGTLLATFTLGNPAFGNAAAKSAALSAVASVTAAATGTAAWFRAANSAGTAQFDGTVGTAGADLNLNTTAIVAGGTVTITGGSVAMP